MTNDQKNRAFMKSVFGDADIVATADIAKGLAQPPLEQPYPAEAIKIALPPITRDAAPTMDFFTCTLERCSRRAYTGEPLSLFELAFLLWCTQGVKKVIGGYRKYLPDDSGRNLLRPVAVGGSVNAYETFVASTRVTDLDPGIWRYLPLSHELVWVTSVPTLPDRLSDVFTTPNQNQHYAAHAAAVFFWTCVPYRGEWRYQQTAHKGMLIDVGHISQNLYLAVEALGFGCCAIGGYHQKKVDHLLAVDGGDEFAVLCATVGHIAPDMKAVYDRFPDLRE